nr:MAG TPA: hypothetical protein [Caudoviricetes sp.]
MKEDAAGRFCLAGFFIIYRHLIFKGSLAL